jgi:hypothetical protein
MSSRSCSLQRLLVQMTNTFGADMFERSLLVPIHATGDTGVMKPIQLDMFEGLMTSIDGVWVKKIKLPAQVQSR